MGGSVLVLLIAVAVVGTLPSIPCAASKDEFSVGVYQNDPYVLIDADGTVRGVCIEVLEHIASREGWKLNYVPGTWTQCLERLKRGDLDIQVAITPCKSIVDEYDFTEEPLMTTWGQAFTRTGLEIESILDCEGRTVALVTDDSYGRGFRDLAHQFNITCIYIESEDYDGVFEHLRAQRADVGIISRLYGERYRRKYGVSSSPVVFAPKDVLFAFPRGRGGEHAGIIDRYVESLKRDEGSVLYRSLDVWLGDGRAPGTPRWVFPVFVSVSILLLLLLVVSMLLRTRIRARTAELSEKNREVRKETSVRMRAEAALREGEERYRTLVGMSPESISIIGLDGTLLDCNEATARITGIPREELVGRSYTDIAASEEEQSMFSYIFKRLLGGDKIEPFELRIDRVGEMPDRKLEVYPAVLKRDGKPHSVVVMARDVTERVEMENRIRQMREMDAVGTLAGAIAHDFNNLLTGILGYANVLKLNDSCGEEVYQAADMIEQAADRASKLTTQLLGFARLGKRDSVSVDVQKIVSNVASFMQRSVEGGVRISQRYTDTPLYVTGDPGQINQVILNLALNAHEAMPQGGELTFETEVVDLDEKFCRTHTEIKPGRYVMVTVTDTGNGIRENIRQKIFEPFFTTKHKTENAGMGLSLVYGFVRNHGGAVDVDSEVGIGTSVKVYLPVAGAAAGSVYEESGEQLVRGKGRILVIDDEELVLKTAAIMLGNLGYDVASFDNAKDAVEYYRSQHGAVDLVLLDMVMPETSGGECFEMLKEINPHARVILSSGYGLNTKAQKLMDEGMAGFIQKPYQMVQLSQVVARVLAGRDSTRLAR